MYFAIEFTIFGNYGGIPGGLILLTMVPTTTMIWITQRLGINVNEILVIIYFLIGFMISYPIFKKFVNWYKNKKQLK